MILRYLFLIPAAVHFGWLAATMGFLPDHLGGGLSEPTPHNIFVLEWLLVTFVANGSFLFVYWRIPSGNDRLLSVPNRAYWLSSSETRAQLIEQLRGLIEISLFCMNLLFLSVYQFIYQGNLRVPLIAVPTPVLFGVFMAAPVLANAICIIAVIRRLKRGDRNS